MARNLKYQIKTCIDNSFKEGMDKHSDKRNQANNKKVFDKTYSYADRKGLVDVGSNFANWMKDNHPEIKQVKDISSDHVQQFINQKAKDGCSYKTLEQYQSKLGKVGDLVNKNYKSSNVNLRNTVIPATAEQTKIRAVAMSDKDFNKLQNKFNEGTSHAGKAIQLTYAAGLRVSECAKIQQRDIKINNDGTASVNVVDGKGKRSRVVDVKDKNSVQILNNLRNSVQNPTDRIVPIQKGSINQAINRNFKSLGMTKYLDAKTSIHSIRKNYAQRQYNSFKDQGLSTKDAWDKTSNLLGHGKNRQDLFKDYIENP